jgi:hypothetical protein
MLDGGGNRKVSKLLLANLSNPHAAIWLPGDISITEMSPLYSLNKILCSLENMHKVES